MESGLESLVNLLYIYAGENDKYVLYNMYNAHAIFLLH